MWLAMESDTHFRCDLALALDRDGTEEFSRGEDKPAEGFAASQQYFAAPDPTGQRVSSLPEWLPSVRKVFAKALN